MEGEPISEVGEFQLIDRLARIVGDQDLVRGIGDDCAVIDQPGDSYLLATVDMLVEGVHFLQEQTVPFNLGRRALAVNLSDIAAMGGAPNSALISVALPPATKSEWVERLYEGLALEARRFRVAIAGGNVARIDGPIAIDVTVLGHVAKDEVVLRSGARVGDVLAVTATLGRAAAGRLLELGDIVPEARIDAGRALAAAKLVSAMLDVSDGLAGDLGHLATASGAGAVIEAELLPIAEEAVEAARRTGGDPIELALNGGEDYELLVALPPGRLTEAQRLVGDVRLTRIGEVVEAERGLVLVRNGVTEPLRPSSWRHF